MNWLDRKIDDFIRHVRDSGKFEKIPIGPIEDPTYWRWFVLPRNPVLNFYLHNFRHSDVENLHDHRAANISVILQGEYSEERFVRRPMIGLPLPNTCLIQVERLYPLFRLPSTPHRVVLPRDEHGNDMPCWSLFIKFFDTRHWGFWCQRRNMMAFWRPYEQYIQVDNPTGVGYGQAGRGCDD